MPHPRKMDPVKHCRRCGSQMLRKRLGSGRLEDRTSFLARVYCDRKCMAEAMEGTIKVMNSHNSHRQSCKQVKPQCEICGASQRMLHVHHVDGDPLNNSEDNLKTLCVPCHRRCHSPNYTDMGRRRKHCIHCEKPSYRRGLCGKHLQRWKKHGDPLLTKKRIGSSYVLVRESP